MASQWQLDIDFHGANIFQEKRQWTYAFLATRFSNIFLGLAQIFEVLTKNFDVIAIDMLGYGFSDKPSGVSYTTDLQVSLIAEVLEELEISSLHIMTFSYGVSVVQEMLAQSKEGKFRPTINSCCFLNGGLFPHSNRPRLTQKLLLGPLGNMLNKFFTRAVLGRNLKAIFGKHTQPSEQLIDQYWQLLNYNMGRKNLPKLIRYLNERRDYAQRWEQVIRLPPCSILLIIGSADSISGARVIDEYRQKVGGDGVYNYEGIGHYPQLEAPDQLLYHYRCFLNST